MNIEENLSIIYDFTKNKGIKKKKVYRSAWGTRYENVSRRELPASQGKN